MPLKNVLEEADRILNEAESRRITLRLFGGVAIYDKCPSAAKEPILKREYADVDLFGHTSQTKEIKELFQTLGYESRARFNALYGGERLVFHDMENMRRIDIFLDIFRMCHTFNFKDRLEVNKRTLPLADLLATKLQVVETTEREYKDTICLLLDHEIGDNDEGEAINSKYLAKLASREWGVYTTFKKSLDKVRGFLQSFPIDDAKKSIVHARIQELARMLDDEPKGLSWKMRAKVGEKTIWYDLPEPDKKVVA